MALTAAQAARVMGANERVHVGIVGLGGRGQDHIGFWNALPDAAITALCDVNQEALDRSKARVMKETQQVAAAFKDMRDLFAAKNVDVVSLPLPNHWHALATIWACQAGKDVYVEKPACHNVFEGAQMVRAARQYKRVVQVGAQGRSMTHKIHAIRALHSGAIGKVYLAKGICYKRRKSIGHEPDSPVPPGLDWDKFLGPAPARPFNKLRYSYNWHWFWDTGNGDIGNQGIHEMDIARWGLGVELPKHVSSSGGKYVYQDDQETPNTQTASFDYGDAEIVFEVRGLLTGGEGALEPDQGNTIGNLFYGSEGWMSLNHRGYQIYKGEHNEKGPGEQFSGRDTLDHFQNFLNVVKTRNRRELNAELETGVTSATLVHIANAAYRVGRALSFTPAMSKFTVDAEANKLLTREYRAPYVVPEKV
jgi:predicted dehydrogenase